MREKGGAGYYYDYYYSIQLYYIAYIYYTG
jgi:hypothetical protein